MQYQELINQGYIYLYRGDRYTDDKYKLQPCSPVLSNTGKCIRGKNGNMLVSFQSGTVVVLARQLRRLDKLALKETSFDMSKVKQAISFQLALPF
jgi:hypothetical protein